MHESLKPSRPNLLEVGVAKIATVAGDLSATFDKHLAMIEEGPVAQFYNTVITVRGGEVVFVHRKINLATHGRLEEGKHYARGRYVETCLLERAGPSWRAGLLICADL